MITLVILNITASPLTYLSGSIVVPPAGSYNVPQEYFYDLCVDGQFRNDILSNKVQLEDTINRYGNIDALKYLERIQGTKDKDGRGITSSGYVVDSEAKQALDVRVLNSIPLVEGGTVTNVFEEVTNVANGVPTTIIDYTLTADKRLDSISCSGTNIAMYEILIDNTIASKKYTYYSGGLSADFNMGALSLQANQNIKVIVTHLRPDFGDFNTNLILKGT